MKKFALILVSVVVCSLTLGAQSRLNMRLNEVLVQPDSTAQDGGWLELYNSSYGSVAIEKMFLTTMRPDELFTDANKDLDRDVIMREWAATDARCYEIPRGDERNTKIAPRSHVVFYTDGKPARGTFHLPFTLAADQDNYVALYDVNGALVDELTVPATLPVGHSYAVDEPRLPQSAVLADSLWQVRDGQTVATAITPGNYNTRAANENIEKFHINDPHGYYIALFAMAIVFGALVLLYLCFKLFGTVAKRTAGDNEPEAIAPLATPVDTPAAGSNDDEVIAAIGLALYQHLNAHDHESGVLTFGPRGGSAWSDKSALMRRLPK